MKTGTVVWVLLLSICLGYELWAWNTRRAPTLSQLIVFYIPWPVALAAGAWVLAHFIKLFADREYRMWLERFFR